MELEKMEKGTHCTDWLLKALDSDAGFNGSSPSVEAYCNWAQRVVRDIPYPSKPGVKCLTEARGTGRNPN